MVFIVITPWGRFLAADEQIESRHRPVEFTLCAWRFPSVTWDRKWGERTRQVVFNMPFEQTASHEKLTGTITKELTKCRLSGERAVIWIRSWLGSLHEQRHESDG
jgi:hypothetical protein